MRDFLVVGAGVYGATLARALTDVGKRVLVIDRRNTLGGMIYSERQEGVIVHRHGPHVLHCNNPEIWKYIQRFTEIIPYRHRAKSFVKGRLCSFPINLNTLNQVFGTRTPSEAKEILRAKKVSRTNGSTDLESWVKAHVGAELYEMFYRDYSLKQWGRKGKDLPEAIVARLPVRLDANDEYFDDEFQGMPREGFTPMIENMLRGIDVRLNADFDLDRAFWESQATRVIYSGSPDALFGFDHGRLEYRSLRLETEIHTDSYQGCPTVNYPDSETPWTRITEFNYFPPNRPGGPTIIMKEYPQEYDGKNEPYYPINDSRNNSLAADYQERAKSQGYVLGGRLGSYRYMDIHQVIAQALAAAKTLSGPSSGTS